MKFEPLAKDQLAESLLFYRRQLTARLIVAFTRNGGCNSLENRTHAVEAAEDMANALTERLAARETGRPSGYKDPS